MSRIDKSQLSPEKEKMLADLFMGQFPDPYHNPRMDKARSLYQLARKVGGGAIVELGTYHGCGAISLAWGAPKAVPVYTVDDYVDKPEWIGTDRFGPADKEIFSKNISLTGVSDRIKLLQMENTAAVEQWRSLGKTISLLFWDFGGARLFSDWVYWHSLIAPHGLFAIHDTADRKFGYDRVKYIALATGMWEEEPMLPGYVYRLRRL